MADHITHQATAAYLAKLKAKLDARTQPGQPDKALHGYGFNVRALKQEIQRVEVRLAAQKQTYQDQLAAEKSAPPAA